MDEDDLVVVYTSVGATAWEVERMLLPLRGAGMHPLALDQENPALGDGPGCPDPRIRIAVPRGEEERALEMLAESEAPAQAHVAEFAEVLRRSALIAFVPAVIAGIITGKLGIAVGVQLMGTIAVMIALSIRR